MLTFAELLAFERVRKRPPSDFPHHTAYRYAGCVECECGATWSLAYHVRMPEGPTWGSGCQNAEEREVKALAAE